MGFFRGVKRVVTPLVNFPRWMSLHSLAEGATLITGVAKRLVTPQTPNHEETFEEALVRLNLTEETLQQRAREFKRLIFIFVTLAIFVLVYTTDLFAKGSVRGVLVGLVIAGFALTQAFRFHFWLYQIKQRRLGCSLREWFFVGLLGMKR